jgi:uncharacterized protein
MTPDWCRHFLETGAQVGVSLDGPREIHDLQRPRRGGGDSFDRVMRGVTLLRESHIPVSALCVLTPLSLAQPKRLFDFFVSERIFSVAFNVEETEGEHRASALLRQSDHDIRSSYSTFMRYFLEENQRRGAPLRVRELQRQSQRLLARSRDQQFCADEAENHVGRIITVSRTGEVSSWSPELASGISGDPARFSLGNIATVDCVDELLDGPRARRIQAEIDEGLARCRETCDYFSVCGGGLPSNKFYENGSFSSSETLRCRLQIQALTDLLLDHATIHHSEGARAADPS